MSAEAWDRWGDFVKKYYVAKNQIYLHGWMSPATDTTDAQGSRYYEGTISTDVPAPFRLCKAEFMHGIQLTTVAGMWDNARSTYLELAYQPRPLEVDSTQFYRRLINDDWISFGSRVHVFADGEEFDRGHIRFIARHKATGIPIHCVLYIQPLGGWYR